MHTYGVDGDVNARTQDFVPLEDAEDDGAVVVDGAEGMEEGGLRDEVLLQRLLLGPRRAGGEFEDDFADFCYWVWMAALELAVGSMVMRW